MLRWNEQFETGHALIDTQHKMLIGYINRLEGMSRITNPTREEAEFFLQLVEFIEVYINVHFTHEESCMARCHCPVYQENKSAHLQFKKVFSGFKEHFKIHGFRPDYIAELHQTCSNWIEQHILRVDVKIKLCRKEEDDGIKPDPE
jgi:hemerythrin